MHICWQLINKPMILLLFWGHEPCIGFFLRRFNTPDDLICYPRSIEKLKLLGATYLLALAAIQQSLAGLLSAIVTNLPIVFLSKHEPCLVDQNVMLFGVEKFVWMAIGKKCLGRLTILKTVVLALLLYPPEGYQGVTFLSLRIWRWFLPYCCARRASHFLPADNARFHRIICRHSCRQE
jgi:hypothetical protein